jgi:nitrite reductase/ring-hydroxylating ferredoxin subunit
VVAGLVAVLVRIDVTLPAIGHLGSALVAVLFLYAPVVVAWRRQEELDDYAFHAAPVRRGLVTAGVAIAVIFPVFALGYFGHVLYRFDTRSGEVRRAIVGAEGDAWTVAPQRQLGAVFLLREGNSVRSWSAICPHVGCLVEWDVARYICRCHDSAFARDGAVTSGISPRGLDPLEVRIDDGVVAVRFTRFRLGTAQRERQA